MRDQLTVTPETGLPKRSLTVATASAPLDVTAIVRAEAAPATKLIVVETDFVPAVAVTTTGPVTQPAT